MALDIGPEHIELSRRFGSKAYYGDASNLDLLKSAHLENTKGIIIAIDSPDASVRTARTRARVLSACGDSGPRTQ